MDLDRVAHLLRAATGDEHPVDPRTMALVFGAMLIAGLAATAGLTLRNNRPSESFQGTQWERRNELNCGCENDQQGEAAVEAWRVAPAAV